MSRHNVWIPDDLWERAQEAARVQSVREGEQVSVSGLIRRSLEAKLSEMEHEGAESDVLPR